MQSSTLPLISNGMANPLGIARVTSHLFLRTVAKQNAAPSGTTLSKIGEHNLNSAAPLNPINSVPACSPERPLAGTPSAFCHRGRFVSQLRNDPQLLAYSPCPLPASSGTSFFRPAAFGGAEAGHLGHRLTSRNFSSISSYLSLFHLRRNLARCSNLRLVSLHPIRFTSTAGHCERHRPWSRLPSLHTLFAPVVSPSCGGGSPWLGACCRAHQIRDLKLLRRHLFPPLHLALQEGFHA